MWLFNINGLLDLIIHSYFFNFLSVNLICAMLNGFLFSIFMIFGYSLLIFCLYTMSFSYSMSSALLCLVSMILCHSIMLWLY